MADSVGGGASGHPNLNLTAEEKRVYGQLFRAADPEGFEVVSGDVAVKFFEKTKLAPDVLGQIWQIADTENQGFLTASGFGVVLRLIGHAQAGRTPTPQLATQPAPLPKFDGNPMQPVAAQTAAPAAPAVPASPASPVAPPGAPPIRVPPLTPEKVGEYSSLFAKSGAENGMLSGVVAKQIFERARLPNEVLGRIWNLSDTQGRGALDTTEFVIAMHLLASFKAGAMRVVPNALPPGLYEAAARKPPVRNSTGSRPGSGLPPAPSIQPQFSGFNNIRAQSPIARQQVGTPLSAQSTGDGWIISAADKAKFDQIFAGLDRSNRGFITGEQAVGFFGNARLPEEVLAQIWDLADINSAGQLSRDEFAVAMYLIRQQRGSKDGRGNLPSTLPPALVPPSMRRQQMQPSQPTAPAFENAPVTQPRSAADDLFGLDAFTTPAPAQQPHSTGGSAGGPFQTSKSPPPSQIPQSTGDSVNGPFGTPIQALAASSTFKPFVPSSSFGQSLAPQATGGGVASQSRSLPQPASEDLLGDADPEVSSRLTAETTELANLSNQIGNLSNQMKEVHGDRARAEQDLAQNTQQKREFEMRLTQLRSAYEQEVKDVKALQERLTASRAETKRLRQDMDIIDGSYQDLQSQRQQVTAALETDQRENLALKEKIRQLNTEATQLRPQLEKLKSDARQQKGLVAINRKQLATNEAERDRLQSELAAAKKELEDAINEAQQTAGEVEQSSKDLEQHSRDLEQARTAPRSAVASPSQVVSPAPSTSSNPFFRRTATATGSELAISAPATNHEAPSDGQNSFDNIFGPSFTGPSSAGPPPVSFRSDTPTQAREPPSEENRSEFDSFTPPMSASGIPDSSEPPEPPKSRQITSAALPLRAPLDRGDSVSSSVRVAPPASRISPAETPEIATPSGSNSSPFSQHEVHEPVTEPKGSEVEETNETSPFEQATPTASTTEHDPMHDAFGPATNTRLAGIPGAFPGTRPDTPQPEIPPAAFAAGAGAATLAAGAGLAAAVTHDDERPEVPKKESETGIGTSSSNRDSNFDNFFGGPAHTRSDSERAADLDSAFSTVKTPPTANGDANTSNREFPPIHELDDAEDSDDSSEAPMAFDDDFNAAPPRPPKVTEAESTSNSRGPQVASALPSHLQAPRPTLGTTPSAGSSLPGIEAQTSPPAYDESTQQNPNHFPPEFKGLLPQREDPTSPLPTAGGVNSEAATANNVQPNYGPEHDRASVQQRKFTTDDFDSVFTGLGAAPVEEDDDEDEDAAYPSHNNGATNFDPTFDSPRPSQKTPQQTPGTVPPPTSIYSSVTNGSSLVNDPSRAKNTAPPDFYGFGNERPAVQTTAPAPSEAPGSNPSHDWDAIFAGIDTPGPTSNVANDFGTLATGTSFPAPEESRATAPSVSTSPPPQQLSSKPTRPTPGRALTEGTEHDDPILKRLTSMGWSRDESLDALEKFDYNIDKAADYLTFKV